MRSQQNVLGEEGQAADVLASSIPHLRTPEAVTPQDIQGDPRPPGLWAAIRDSEPPHPREAAPRTRLHEWGAMHRGVLPPGQLQPSGVLGHTSRMWSFTSRGLALGLVARARGPLGGPGGLQTGSDAAGRCREDQPGTPRLHPISPSFSPPCPGPITLGCGAGTPLPGAQCTSPLSPGPATSVRPEKGEHSVAGGSGVSMSWRPLPALSCATSLAVCHRPAVNKARPLQPTRSPGLRSCSSPVT